MSTPPKYENHLDDKEARWFAVYTKYKREKVVKQQLEDKEIETYLPLQRLTRHYTRKVKKVELPLISCYIFTKITKKEYVSVLETQDVVHFVKFAQNLIAIPEQEMEILRRVVGEGNEVTVEPSSLQPGDEVEVIGGQLTGLKGKLIKQNNQNNLVIELNTLGYNLLMQVAPSLLKKTGRKLQ